MRAGRSSSPRMDKPGISVEANERGEEIRLGGKLGGMTLAM